MYFPSLTALNLAQPLMFLTMWSAWGADATRSGGCAFSEGVRCPLEAWGWGGSDGGVRVE
jgi:hypothetical protein